MAAEFDASDFDDRFAGCPLGGAYGDALGAPVEFLSLDRIRAIHGTAGITELKPSYGLDIAAITDDTQMTLFPAEGVLRSLVRHQRRGIAHLPSLVHGSLLRWLLTQGEKSQAVLGRDQLENGWLISVRALHARRAPGNTCLSALRQARELGAAASNDSKGCGAVMRAAPIGLAGASSDDLGRVFEAAVETSRFTHGHPSGYLSAAVFAALIAQAVRGTTWDSALANAIEVLQTWKDNEETLAAVAKAERLARSGFSIEALEQHFSGGWTGEDALAMALYCCLASTDFEEAVTRAVNHSGDSDSTGSLVGNLLGARYGLSALPMPEQLGLELADVIRQVAEDLARAVQDPEWLESEGAATRYPPW